MGYSREAYEYALDAVKQRRSASLNRCDIKKAEIYRAVPQLETLDRQISHAGVRAVKAATAFNGTDELIKIRAEYAELESKRETLLKSCGISQADFEPVYECAKCSDTGYFEGYMCSCAKDIARKFEFDRLNSSMPLDSSTFESFDLSYYNGPHQTAMRQVVEYCDNYADCFTKNSPSLLFHGKTGLGKTHLSLAIANKVLANGFGVMYSSAQNFLERLEREHFGRSDDDTMQLISECDLLIIDDLGAEFQTSFTVSAIYNIINARIMNGLPTIISTNLPPAEITKIYGERVMSRILGSFRRFEFSGVDIRQQKMLKGNAD